MTTTLINGHECYFNEQIEQWCYCDTKEPVIQKNYREDKTQRPCPHCGHSPSPEGHDYCIQNLGFVIQACCGHGKEEGYIQFNDGTVIRGVFKIERPPAKKVDQNVTTTKVDNDVNIRDLVYDFLNLPSNKQTRILLNLSLLSGDDQGRKYSNIMNEIINRAKASNKLKELHDKIKEEL